ncbi:pirin family protein [Corynebacterium suicordis]|uniref:pirin family protein n=1 Tax=uncultured Corynebacterium sp. TaxID=159447 RepID=UPI0025986D87|nr:pirin family protein [uncultured Corynebacterium sp.]
MSTTTIIPASDRQRWKDSTVDSRQSFPATGNFDLIDNSWGLLMIHNDDVVSPGEGFDMHQHDNAEIVTWIMDGSLRHRDSEGTDTILKAGHAQAISAGRGVRHSEVNAAGFTSSATLHVIQMWLPPDEENTDPRHGEADFTESIAHSRRTGEFFTVAAGKDRAPFANRMNFRQTDSSFTPPTPLSIGSAGAQLDIAHLEEGKSSTIATSHYVHLFVAKGTVQAKTAGSTPGDEEENLTLSEGDVLRIDNSANSEDPANSEEPITLTASADAVILAWHMDYSARDRKQRTK